MATLPEANDAQNTPPEERVCITCGWQAWEHLTRPEHCALLVVAA